MASIFQRGRSDVWIAAFRAWDAKRGAWVWRQQSTGTRDRAAAAGIAATLEQGSTAAKAGSLTREKALRMVNDILRLAGLDDLAPVPSLESVAKGLLSGSDVSASTGRKYAAQWSAHASHIYANQKVINFYLQAYMRPIKAYQRQSNQTAMPHISVKLDKEADELIQALATKERRSKREQLAFSAITHARSLLPDFKPMKRKQAK